MARRRSDEQKSKDLRQKSKDLLSIADALNSNPSDEKCALTCATTALALEQRRTADVLERLCEKLDSVVIDGKFPKVRIGGVVFTE